MLTPSEGTQVEAVRDQFRKISAALAAQAEVASGTGHAATTGKLRELLIHRFFRPHLPSALSIRSGIIIDSEGHRSRQQDCVIVDGRLPLIDVGSETEALIIAESVIATIEVKSYLSKDELLDALESAAVTKGLLRKGEQVYRKGPAEIHFPKPMPILTYVFAYDGLQLPTASGHVNDFATARHDGGIVPEAICILRQGVLLRSSLIPTVVGSTVKLPSAAGKVELTGQPYQKDALFTFYRRFIDDVMPLRMAVYDIDPYYSATELE
jgi:hypothetical protein